jgi:hypothetical protein
MSYMPKLAALVALSASALLGVACVGGPADRDAAPAQQAPEALQSSEAPSSPVLSDGDDDAAVDEATGAEHWDSWRFGPCRRFRHCVHRRGFHFCARRMPRAAFHCSRGSYPPGQDWGEGRDWSEDEGPGDHGGDDHGGDDHGGGDHGGGDHGGGDHGHGDHGHGDHGHGDHGHGDHGPGH